MYHLNLEGHTSIVVTLSIIGKTLFSGSMDGTLKMWNLETFQCERESQLGPVFSIKVLHNFMFSGHLNCVKVWELQGLTCKATLSGHVGNVKALYVMGNRLFTGSSDRSIKIWNLDNFTLLHTLTNAHDGEIRDMVGVTEPANNNAMVHLWTCADDHSIRVWNKSFGCDRMLTGHKGAVKCLVKIGEFIFSGSDDTYIKIWSVINVVEVSSISTLVPVTSLTVWNLSNVPSLISGHGDGVIKVWNLQNIQNIECSLLLSAHTEPVRCLLTANNIFFSGGYDKTIKVWYPQHQRLEFSNS